MVLRFSCPCGAPYALADHLAGRTFTCTTCGQVLQIGTPAAAPPPPPPAQPPPGAAVRKSGAMKAPASDLGKSLEWGAKKTSGGLKALDPDEKAPPKAPPAKDAPLSLADDDEEEAEEEEEEADEEGVWNSLEEDGPAPKKGGKRSPSSAGGRTSGAGKALRTSGAGKVPAGSARQKKQLSSARQPALPAAESISMRCPVCDTEIARAAPSCPSCGVRLKAPGFADKMAAGAWKGPVKAVGLLIAASVIGTVIYKAAVGDKGGPPRPPSRPIDPPTEVAATEAPPTESAATETASTETASTETASTETASTETASTETTSTEAPSGATERPRPPRPSGDLDGAEVVIPKGPLEADLKRLRDAKDGAPAREAIAALAAKPGAAEAVAASRAKSHDKVWQVRLHRVRLAIGDAGARRTAIEASLASEADGTLPLLHTAAAAIDLDPQGLRPALEGLSLASPAQIVARAWVDAALDGSAPRGGTVEAIRNAWPQADGDTRLLLGPLLALAGDGTGLDEACGALEHDSATVRGVAAKGLEAASGGSGPGGADPAAWRAWVERYRPLRDLVVRGCGPFGEATAEARRTAIKRMAEVSPLLATIVRDRAVQTPEGGQALGDLIGLGARPTDAPALNRMLAALEPEWATNGGAYVLRGALLAADDAVAEAVAAALVRGAARAEELGPICPDLIRVPSAKAIETLSTWADGKGDEEARQAARLVQASFRTPALDSWVQGDVQAAQRDPVVARLASARLEAQLFKAIEQNHEAAAAARDMLIVAGGETAADRITKLVTESPTADTVMIFERLADARLVKRIRRAVETATHTQESASTLITTFGRLAPPEEMGALARHLKENTGLQQSAREALLRVPCKETRDLLKPQVEAIDPAGEIGIDLELAVVFARSAGPEDAALLRKLLRTIDRYNSTDQQVRLILAAAQAQVPEGCADLGGYVQAGVQRRGIVAVALALLQHKDLVPRARTVLESVDGSNAELEDLLVAVAVAVASPDTVKDRLPKLVPRAIELGEEGILTLSVGLARLGLSDGLTQLARCGKEQSRPAVARGIAWAALGSSSLPRLPIVDELLFDPDPTTRAQAAVAAAIQGHELGARCCMAALHGGGELDEPRRAELRALAALTRVDTPTLRMELWHALDRAMPGEAPPMRNDFPPGRVRDRIRTARAQLLGKN